jgi:hypothetical protein
MPPQGPHVFAPVALRPQVRPASQVAAPPNVAAGQQAWFMPPQAVQACAAPVPVQAKPASQVPRPKVFALGQQAWPPPPHASHVPPVPFIAPAQVPPG